MDQTPAFRWTTAQHTDCPPQTELKKEMIKNVKKKKKDQKMAQSEFQQNTFEIKGFSEGTINQGYRESLHRLVVGSGCT